MIWVILMGFITVLSVFFGIKRKKVLYFFVPFGSILLFMLIKIMMVPLPFMETVRFIFDIRG
ncbi:hypothetical protein KO561_13935 [Radiobacillus kanasensis]|uniref:hypothetical protein n=1 Tax=Radiobacillus kanasensis TaxID=2844358 RepID=UPI001E34AC62|nr:hypothetical protein [Radiobacillus kanasensis]UFT98296.1 hypothetical protein KO561_13935 [Radiobacillus kanasensis]